MKNYTSKTLRYDERIEVFFFPALHMCNECNPLIKAAGVAFSLIFGVKFLFKLLQEEVYITVSSSFN